MKNSDLPIGFTPVRNKRIMATIGAVTLALVNTGWRPEQAEAEGVRRVARTLAPLPHQRRHRAPRPSKSDDPAYRKVCVA